MRQLGILLVLVSVPVLAGAEPAVGTYVILKRPVVAVLKDYKAQSPDVLDRPNDVSFRVGKTQGDWVWIYTPRGMGWVLRNDVLTPDDAIAFFTTQIDANLRDAESWGRRGVALSSRGDLTGAVRDLTEAHRLHPGDARWLHYRAQCYTATYILAKTPASLLENATADVVEAARLDPKNAEIVSLEGSIWHMRGDAEKARCFAESALRLDPGCADAYCLRAMLREDAHKADQALEDYSKAIALNPGHVEAYNNRMLLYWNLHAYDRVIEDATASLRLGNPPAQAYRVRGLAYVMKRDADKALADLDMALQLQPGDRGALVGRSLMRQIKGDLVGATRDMEEASAGAPRDLMLLPTLASLQMRVRNWPRALETVQRWAALAPDDPRPHGRLADLYATCPDGSIRDGKKAVECARRACELTQWKSPYTLDTLAAASAEAGDFAGAIRWEKSALQDPSFAARNGAQARARLQLYEAGQPYHNK